MDVGDWLRSLGLSRYEPAFRENRVDADVLPKLTREDLRDLGVAAIGDRRRLLAAIEHLLAPARSDRDGAVPRSHGARRQQLTVLFCDLVGSTALANRLDPEDTGDIIQQFQQVCADAVTQYDGYVAKFMGDGMLAYFGYPAAHEDDAERAVRAGLECAAAVAALETAASHKLLARVGVATGPVVVGYVAGQGFAREETVVGEPANLAARLQSIAEPGAVVISETTRRLLGGVFELAALPTRAMKGFDAPVHAWRALRLVGELSRFEASRAPNLTPVVGRRAEVEQLEQEWRLASEGQGRTTLVTGEAGIGKSRLLVELKQHVEASQGEIFLHQCSPHHINEAFYPLAQRLRRSAGLAEGEPAAAQLDKIENWLRWLELPLLRAAPLITGLLCVQAGDRYHTTALSASERRQQTIDVLLEIFEALCGKTPTLFVLEDAHWSDPTTLEVIGQLVGRLPNMRGHLVVTYRPEFTPPWVTHEHVARIELLRFSPKHALKMLIAAAGASKLPREVKRRIVSTAEGVPLFIEELTKTVLHAEAYRRDLKSTNLSTGAQPTDIPATLQNSLTARLDRLGPAKDIALVAATIGREFSFDLLEKSCEAEAGALRSALEKLVEADIVRPSGGAQAPLWEFKHALLRDAAYQMMVRPRRRETHACIADALERNFPDQIAEAPAIVAQHWGQAGRPEKAAPYFRAAAESAGARSANVEAVAYLDEGLRMVTDMPADEIRDRVELPMRLMLAGALRGSKGFAAPETGEAYLRAHRLCEAVGTPPQKVAALNGLYSFHLVRSEVDLAGEIADSLLSYVEQDADVTNLMIARRSVGCQRLMLGRLGEAIERFESSLALYDPKTHGRLAFLYGTDHKQTAASFCSHALWLSGSPERAEAMQRMSLRHAESLNHGPSIAQALTYLSFLRVMARDLDGVVEPATRQLQISRRVSFLLMEASARFWLAAARRGKSRPDEILEEMQAATRLWWSTGASQYRGYVLTLIAETCLDADRIGEGLAAIDEAERLLPSTNERWGESELHRVKAMLLWRQGASRAAVEDVFRHGLAVARDQGALMWELRSAVSLACWLEENGRRDEGVAKVESVYRMFNEGFAAADLREAHAFLETAGAMS